MSNFSFPDIEIQRQVQLIVSKSLEYFIWALERRERKKKKDMLTNIDLELGSDKIFTNLSV